MRKDDEIGQPHNRSVRVFEKENEWYFRARETAPVGPFWNEVEAYIGLRAYLKYHTMQRRAG